MNWGDPDPCAGQNDHIERLEEEIKKLRSERADLWDEVRDLEAENRTLRLEIQDCESDRAWKRGDD